MNSLNLAQALSGPRESLEANVAALEGLPYALSYANTSAALHTLAKLLTPGERVLIDENAPPLLEVWNQMGLAVERVPLLETDLGNRGWNGTRLVWTSRTTEKLLDGARRQGALVLLDSTLEPGRGACGADLVYYGHSAALSGHGDLTVSLLATGSQALYEELAVGRIPPGTIESLLALSGMNTLELRLARSRDTADLLHASLERHPAIVSIGRVGAGVLRLELRELTALYNLTLFTGMQLGASESAYQLRGDHALFSIGIEPPRALLGDLIAALSTHGTARASFEVPRSSPPERLPLPDFTSSGLGRIITPADPSPTSPLHAEQDSAQLAPAPEPYYVPAAALPTTGPSALLSHRVPADEFVPAVPTQEIALEPSPELTPDPSPEAPLEPQPFETVVAQGFDPAKQDPTEGLSEEELRRYNRLRDWRNDEAKSLKLSRFIIASNATLAGVAQHNPRTLEALRAVRGMGENRVEKYGQAMLELLRE